MLIDRSFTGEESKETGTGAELEDRSMYEELGELAKYVEANTRAIQDIEAPVADTANQLPQATCFLSDLSQLTEEGTHRVMAITEEIEESRGQIMKKLNNALTRLESGENPADARTQICQVLTMLGQNESRLMDITVALSFQDLVAQRVKKLVTILEDVQHRFLKLVVVFGLKQSDKKTMQESRGFQMLKQLQHTGSNSLKQDLVDDILGEFGFDSTEVKMKV